MATRTQPPIFPLGRILMTLANLFYSLGAFNFDWNETHIYNPRWPPHARFHNGQTMTLGALLATFQFYLLARVHNASSTTGAAKGAGLHKALDSLWLAAIVGSLYCSAGLSAILYPGAGWTDPEFGETKFQLWAFSLQVATVWAGYALEKRRLMGMASKAA